jgi:hypothetical protein
VTPARLAAALCAVALAAPSCVVTTYEGPAEPPRVTPRPPPPGQPSVDEAAEQSGSAGGTTDPRQPGVPRTIAASHLVVMHQGSMRAQPGVTRTREQARQRAQEALARARAGEDFEKLVAEYSDEPNAVLRKGALGRFSRDEVVEPFADAAFQLEPGEISEVVETPFGFHVIQRTQ